MKRNTKAGLTQLELLVSLAIMGLIAVFLANLLSYNGSALTKSRDLGEVTETYLAHFDLRKHVESIPLERPANSTSPLLAGGSKNFQFVSSRKESDDDQPEFVGLIVELVRSSDGQENVVLSPVNIEEGRLTRIIETGVSSFSIRYFGRIKSEPDKRWHTEWRDDTFLPDLIKVEWKNAAKEPQPPLTLRPAKVAIQSFMSLSSLVPPG